MTSRVKSVLTGDTLILVANGEEKQIQLAYIQSPRTTEPFGFAAREYLRKFALNKPVKYRQLYVVNNREFGDCASPVFNSLIEHLLKHGYAKLRNDAAKQPTFAAVGEKLEAAQSEAQNKNLGVWASNNVAIQLCEISSSIYGSNRKVPAIIEKVQNGDRVILRAMFTEREHYVGPAFIAGIRVRPTTNEAIAQEAIKSVESKLLQRDCRAVFHTQHELSGHPMVTIIHPQGNIAEVLVSTGLAEVVNLPIIGSDQVLALRNAEQKAKQSGAGIWKAAAQQRSLASSEFANLKGGTVTKVISGDRVVVDKDEVTLSSVRAPRRNEDPENAARSKEFLRKLLIGQKVKISVDGAGSPPSSADGGATQQQYNNSPKVTLSFGTNFSKNAGLEIIKAGYATTMHHRRDDLARSPFYDEFVEAEEEATKKQIGIFKKRKDEPVRAVQDASESVVRARAYLPVLLRKGSFSAVVDFVISAGRLRLNVNNENCTITTVMDGARVGPAGSPFSEEALQYVQLNWNQRDVQCTVKNVDKTGAFISTIKLGNKSLAEDLVSRGFATVFGNNEELEAAEEDAISKKVGVWSLKDNVSEEEEAEEAKPDAAAASAPSYQDAVLSYVTPELLYVRLAPQEAKHKQLQSGLKEFFTAAINAKARSFQGRPQRRAHVVDSKTYERGIVSSVRANKCEVEFVDTGAVLEKDVSELLPLPEQFSLGSTPALSRSVALQFVHKPVRFYEDAYVKYINQYINKPVVVYGNQILLADSKSAADSLNYRLVANGLASVPVADKNEEAAQRALDAQLEAEKNRKGMWEYGDPREDEDM